MVRKRMQFEYPTRMVGVIFLGMSLIIFGIFFFLQTHQVFSANFADEVLRPLLGSKTTIFIESVFFVMQDNMNQIKYYFIKPDSHVFSDVKMSVPVPKSTQSTFSLAPIRLSHPTFPGEGVWTPISTGTNDALLAQTFIQPDPSRSYAIVALVKINMAKVTIGSVAGTWEPGEASKRGPGMVPLPIQQSNTLIAAFNGGFQKKDGAYGMIVGNTTYLPLQNNLATFVMYKDKNPQLFRYTGQKLPSDVTAVRQNGPMLVENKKIVTSSALWNMQTWGLTTTNSMYTWRSGLGITQKGNIVYAVGPSLIPDTLALALQKAGAVNAMQLDINPVWVRFVLYNSVGNGKYTYQMLLKDMANGGLPYLTGYQKDFFYVYKKPADPQISVVKQPLTIFAVQKKTTYDGMLP